MKHLDNVERPYCERHKGNKLEGITVGIFWLILLIGWIGLIAVTVWEQAKQ